MENNIFIPKKIKVGYQKRDDTYSKKLAYVTYIDEKGILRKEKSWEDWRDKEISADELENTPISGFVLNKDAGGRGYSYYDSRTAYIRVYDPRGFEIEITVPNLLYILENTDCIKGKGLEGEFVYGWSGTELVLIPISSPDYTNITEFSNKKYSNFELLPKELKIGATYLTKNNEKLTYMGKRECLNYNNVVNGKKYIFAYEYDKYVYFNSMSSIKDKFIDIVDETVHSKYNKFETALNRNSDILSPFTKKANMYYSLKEFKEDFINGKDSQEYFLDFYISGSTTKDGKTIIKKINDNELSITITNRSYYNNKIEVIQITPEQFVKTYKPYRLVDLKK